jgi:hypothetical protein
MAFAWQRSRSTVSLVDLQDEALQILGLGDVEDYRMIGSRPTTFQKTKAALCITGSRCHYTLKFIPENVV